jgi:hypothetical protein
MNNKSESMNSNKQYNTRSIYNHCVNEGLIDKKLVPYMTFYKVIRQFHKEISDKIIFDTYQFKTEIGQFEVLRDERKGKSIDWNASKKRKQEIIDSGNVPFNAESNPDGIKWFVYHEGDYFKWNWFKDKGISFTKNIKFYVFKPTSINRRAVAKAVKNNPFAELDYGIHR